MKQYSIEKKAYDTLSCFWKKHRSDCRKITVRLLKAARFVCFCAGVFFFILSLGICGTNDLFGMKLLNLITKLSLCLLGMALSIAGQLLLGELLRPAVVVYAKRKPRGNRSKAA